MLVLALILGRRFPAANATPVDVDLLWLRVPNVEVWLLIISCVALGALGVGLSWGFTALRGWVITRRYRKAIRRLEAEVHQLRSLPLAGSGADPQPPAAAVTTGAKG